ncbi:hypothetical protein EVAR_91869_1 [Eumeta japonica]|uniref:Helitron helicase-like domain-containing protein n=1 Tax=Eumeta variegata TaxID=151549 RepID=A0A4C1SN56_EUMVA|nr:hypothetical protein EVAR_91869_1 [Eumeta japonica]
MVPTPDEPHQFCKYISSMVDQCAIYRGAQQLKRRIIEQLQAFFHANNAVVMFSIGIPSDTHKFVIRADCTPTAKSNIMHRVEAETHRLYDALQYQSFIGEADGYDITLKMVSQLQQSYDLGTIYTCVMLFIQMVMFQNIGRLTILPSAYIGSPPHARIRSRRYDVRAKLWNSGFIYYGHMQSKWTEIERELEPGQNKIAMT